MTLFALKRNETVLSRRAFDIPDEMTIALIRRGAKKAGRRAFCGKTVSNPRKPAAASPARSLGSTN